MLQSEEGMAMAASHKTSFEGLARASLDCGIAGSCGCSSCTGRRHDGAPNSCSGETRSHP